MADVTATGQCWYEASEGELAGVVDAWVTRLLTRDAGRREDIARWYAMYSDEPGMSLSPYVPRRRARRDTSPSFNVVRSIVQTVDADLAAVPPSIRMLTDAADWTTRQQARVLERFALGLAYDVGALEVHARVRLLGSIAGSAFAHWYSANGRVVLEAVHPHEILVDQDDGRAGAPRSIFRLRYVDRNVLAAVYPEQADEIRRAPRAPAMESGLAVADTMADIVRVVYGWHLRSSDEATDGVHVVTLPNVVLEKREWERGGFPLAKWDFDEEPMGYFGRGVPAQLEREQRSIAKQLRAMDKALEGAVPTIVLHEDAAIETAHISNIPWNVIKSKVGAAGYQVIVPSVVTQDRNAFFQGVLARCYEAIGASQLAASARKPAGLDSGVALEAYADATSLRHVMRHQRAGQTFVRIVEGLLEEARELAESGQRLTATYRDSGTIEQIEWERVADCHDYRIECTVSSAMPRTPAGRLRWVEDQMRLGLMDAEQAREAMQSLDPASVTKRQLSRRAAVEKILARIVQSGENEPPQPLMDFAVCREACLDLLHEGIAEGMPEETQALLRAWFVEVVRLEQAAAPAPESAGAAMPAEAMGAPPGMPMQ